MVSRFRVTVLRDGVSRRVAATPFELFEPFHRYLEPAQRRMGIAQLRIAVPIRAAADGEPEALSELREPPLGGGGVARVANLEAVQTLLLELPDLAFAAVVAQVRRHRDPAYGVHQIGDLAQTGERLLDVARPAAAQVAREGIVDVGAGAALHEHPRHVGTAQRPAVRGAHDVRDLDLQAQLLQSADHLLGAATTRGTGPGEEVLELWVAGRQEVAEQVQLPPRGLDAELAPGNDAEAERRAFARRLRDPVRRVVIGQRDGREARRPGPPRHFGRLILAVRRGRVAVQVNARHTRSPARSTQAVTGGTAAPARAPTARRAPPRCCGSPPGRSA